MACPSCKNPVAGNARVCPNCGHRFTHPFVMVLAGLFVCFLVAMIVDVGKNNSASGTTAATPAVASGAAHAGVEELAPLRGEPARLKTPQIIDEKMRSFGVKGIHSTATGPKHTVLVMHDRAAGQLQADAIGGNTELLQGLRELGFTKVIYTNDGSIRFAWELKN